MLHTPVPATFEDITKSYQVGVNVSFRMGDRIAHPRLRGEMHHAIEFLRVKKSGHRLTVNDIQLLKMEVGVAGRALETRLLQPDIVIVAHIIDAVHRIAPL